ncbi:hypothetical protein S7711_11005 [Stachybotrys chartarum IBT 7711]|uniref:F-box domain-containing protein n=1 Tax=Stachybotrys chartarum (strain CBS 109288 / IBT 7711) TaxID=1280523 RepID=A0A084B8K9_STACB|nr:hypothetical protein S7711_11005 [Stachybotrys chartarum IBT 7711]
MRKDQEHSDEDLEPLVDTTEALKLHSKRTERAQKKQSLKARKPSRKQANILQLPVELALQIVVLLRPSDVLSLAQVDREHHYFIDSEEPRIAYAISSWRYDCLRRCFRLPVLMTDVEPAIHAALQHEERQELLAIHKKPYQHVQPPDAARICTCLTCVLRWSALCIAVDFAHWQDDLDNGEPIPMIPRGQQPVWNEARLSVNADKVWRALRRPLWHARVLEAHLASTVRSIRRHAVNRGNQRRRFAMNSAEAASGTDAFLELNGPPTLDFPFHRDAYYMLEAYLPNRSWNGDVGCWMYVPAEQHDTDLQFVILWAQKRADREARDILERVGV